MLKAQKYLLSILKLAVGSQNNSYIVGAIMPSIQVKKLMLRAVRLVHRGKEHS